LGDENVESLLDDLCPQVRVFHPFGKRVVPLTRGCKNSQGFGLNLCRGHLGSPLYRERVKELKERLERRLLQEDFVITILARRT
jgi:hypothetical protein